MVIPTIQELISKKAAKSQIFKKKAFKNKNAVYSKIKNI